MGETWYQKMIIALKENLPYVAIIALSGVVIFVFKLYVSVMTAQHDKDTEEIKFWKDAFIKTNEQIRTEKRIDNSRADYRPGYPPANDDRGRQE